MRNKLIFLFSALIILSGCGKPPEQPHIYVVGVDCSRSFWNTSLVSEKRYADLPKAKVQRTSYKIREYLNELNIVAESKDFIRQTRVESGNFRKAVDRDAIRKEIESAADSVNVLSNDIGTAADKQYLTEKIKAGMSSLKTLLEKRNYLRVSGDSGGQIFNEDINSASLNKINKYISLINDEVDKFSYTVNIPDQPRLLKELQGEISSMLNIVDSDINSRNTAPIDKKWINSGIYGKMRSLNTVLYFRIGDTQSTVCKPLLKDINADMASLIENSYTNGVKVFSNSTDYAVFVQRSFREIENLINDWGGFDPDIGIKVTFIIVGDGKNDPNGKYENVAEYDKELLGGIKELFVLKKENASPALSAISSIDIKFCVPQKRYNTDILDSWSQLLHGGSNGGAPAVYYYMFEGLKQNGVFTPESVKKLIE
jgi:hypothetical protein